MSWPAAVQAIDERILHAALGWPPALVPLFYVATVLGGGWALVGIVPFALREATRAVTLRLLAAVTIQATLVSLLKLLFGRLRPCDALGWCAPVWIASPHGFSFPSGHAAGAFCFAAFVAALWPRWAPLALLGAALVAASRVVLGVHYPSDVLAGSALGAAVGVGFARSYGRSLASSRSTSVSTTSSAR